MTTEEIGAFIKEANATFPEWGVKVELKDFDTYIAVVEQHRTTLRDTMSKIPADFIAKYEQEHKFWTDLKEKMEGLKYLNFKAYARSLAAAPRSYKTTPVIQNAVQIDE